MNAQLPLLAIAVSLVAYAATFAEGLADGAAKWRRAAAAHPVSGRWNATGEAIAGETDAGDVFGRIDQVVGDTTFEADVTLTEGNGAAALVFRASPSMESLYAVTLDHRIQVVRLFKWPSPVVLQDVPFELRVGVAYRVLRLELFETESPGLCEM
jgi:hypothetical protein